MLLCMVFPPYLSGSPIGKAALLANWSYSKAEAKCQSAHIADSSASREGENERKVSGPVFVLWPPANSPGAKYKADFLSRMIHTSPIQKRGLIDYLQKKSRSQTSSRSVRRFFAISVTRLQ